MPLTQITTSGIANGAVTTAQLAPGAAGGPKITQVQITNSSGTVLDDTAISLSGGYIKITGTGFAAGAQVIVNNATALSTTFTSTTVLNAQVGPQSAGTYIVYVVNTDGGVAIAVNGLTYSSEPTWVTGSTLPAQLTAIAISIQLNATGATVYTLAAGSTLPSGLSLSSGGLLSGTVNVVTETTYSFVVNAIDAELQDSPRTFSLTVNVAVLDPFFYLTSLLLPGNGANNATNNTFLDSSTNNFTVTRNGNSTQGNFSPFSQTGWSNYLGGDTSYLTVSANNFSTGGSWTIEAWCYFTNSNQNDTLVNGLANDRLYINWLGTTLYLGDAIVNNLAISNAKPINTWFHVAMVKNGGTYTAYINGTSVGSSTTALQSTTLTTWQIGARPSQNMYTLGYISNFRITTNAVYTANFTPSTTPLTAITGTTLLTCQSNRFIDNSTNNSAITLNGSPRVQAFSPFNPTIAYSAAVVGGSGYFDGSGDYLTLPANTAFDFGTGDFTVECWVYLNTGASSGAFLSGSAIGSTDLVYFDSSLRFGRNNVAWDTTISFTLLPNVWYHVVFIKESGVAKIYVNGSLIGSAANTNSYGSAGGTSIVNASRDLSRQFPGYISGYRIVKGTAVYTANFTPPTAPPTAIANTSVLLNFTNDPIADATSKNAVETVGDTKTSTVQSKWGGSSIFFDGSDSLSIPPTNLQLNLGARNFTIEMWAYLTGGSGNLTLFQKASSYELVIDSNRWVWQINANTNVFVTNGSLTQNTWTHVAIVRNGSTTTLYLNGTAFTSGTSTNATDNTNPLRIGAGAQTFTGYINDFRITNGLARYTSNFTPPTAAFPIQ
jgi:hypothetical protein